MISIRRLIPVSSLKEIDAHLKERDLSALVVEAHSDALIGFVNHEANADGEFVAVYDAALAINSRARQIQADEAMSDDEALEQAQDEFSWDASFMGNKRHPVYIEIGGDYYGMTFDAYQENAKRTAQGMEDPQMLANWGLGLAGEAGEVIEVIKKHLYHGKDLDKSALIKELGDVLWYVAAICSQVGIDLEDVAERNVDKLSARYPNGFVKGGGKRD